MPTADSRQSGPLVAGLCLLVAAFGVTIVRSSQPRPLAANAPAHEFSAARASDVLRTRLATVYLTPTRPAHCAAEL